MNNQFIIPNFVHDLLAVSTKGIDQIVRKLSFLLSHTVLVTDPFYQVLSSSQGNETIPEIVIVPTQKQVINIQISIVQIQISTIDSIKNGFSVPITINNKNLGFLILYGNDQEIDIAQYEQVLLFATSLCAIQMQKKIDIRKEKSKFKEAFLFDLLYGNIKQREDIVDYGKIWGWDFHEPHTVLVISFREYEYFFTNKSLINTLLQLVEKELILHDINPIAMVKQNQVITVIPTHNSDKNQDWLKNFAKKILDRADNLMSNTEIACGFGKVYDNPTELFRSYQEAKIAFELGILLEVDVPNFTDLGLERILYRHDLQDLKEYYEHTIGSLIKYDAKHEGNFIETLEALAANQFDMGKTANALYLHRNTLRYRVKKIEEILEVKLDDINVRLNITAAFKIKQLRKLS